MRHFPLCLLALYALLASTHALVAVDVSTTPAGPVPVAVLSAAGLDNRNAASVYVLQDSYDSFWASTLLSQPLPQPITPSTYLESAFRTHGAILYSSAASVNGSLLPAIVTLAGLLDAIPMDVETLQPLYPGTKIVMDVRKAFNTPEDGVSFCVKVGLNRTTSLAMQDGMRLYQQGSLADWIVNQRLFAMYLPNGCVPFTSDNALLKDVVNASPWSRPVRVYGYNSLDVLFGGDLFEAETNCVDVLGQVATAGTINLSFMQYLNPLTPGSPKLVQPPSPPVTYNASKSYVALVYGDMDNIDFVYTFGSDHMRERASRCNGSAMCFPLTWTLSPNLIKLAPAMMRWYFKTAATTGGRDWFIMPPCGTLYSYPGEMPSDVQGLYVTAQNEQAAIMNTTGSVHWEWIFTWSAAWNNYFPRYNVSTSGVHAFFLNNVPWVIPILDMWLAGETYRWAGAPDDPAAVVGFRPAFNWQENGPGGGNPGNASTIAGLVNALPLGSVQYIYVIQNTPLSSVFDMVSMLEPHVQLLGYEQLIEAARQAALLKL